jgi:PAS domain S-box-containing protein/putative nucleotidyltransferase with HDIG domain
MENKQEKLDVNGKLIEEIDAPYSKDLVWSVKTDSLKCLLEATYYINQKLLTVKSKDKLLQKICNILTEIKDYKVVWIGLLDRSKHKVIPVALSGFGKDYLSSIKFNFNKSDPIETIISTNKPIVVKDIEKNQACRPLGKAALKKGCHSSVLLKINLGKEVIGILNVYSKKDSFDHMELKFLEEVAGDIAVGIRNIETKENLLRSEERFKELVLQLPESIFEMDTRGNITFANDNAFSDFGYTQEDIYRGINVSVLVIPEERKRLKLALGELISENAPGPVEFLGLRKDGSRFPVIVNANTIKNREGKVTGVRGILIDITEKNNLLEQIKLSEAKYRTIFENSSNATAIIEDDTTISLVNSAFEKISGFKKAEVEGKKKWAEFVSKKDLVKMDKYHKLRRKNPDAAPNNYEFEFINRHGVTRNIIISVEIIPQTKSSIASLLDITEQRETSEKLARSYNRLKNTLDATIEMIGGIVETRDFYTAGHQKRVAKLSVKIAEEMKLSGERIEALRMAAAIHDLGKISTPAEILSKPGRISEAEFSIIKEHPRIGYNIIKMIDFPIPIAEIILQHHERINGSGYPDGLKGKDILLEAKVLAVADSVEAMISHRPYRPAMGLDKTIEELKKNKGKLYDRKVVDVCIKILKSEGFKL